MATIGKEREMGEDKRRGRRRRPWDWKTRKRTPGFHSLPLSTITASLSPEIKHKARCHPSHAICSTPPPLSV